jgi:hypothetical protein
MRITADVFVSKSVLVQVSGLGLVNDNRRGVRESSLGQTPGSGMCTVTEQPEVWEYHIKSKSNVIKLKNSSGRELSTSSATALRL